MRGAIGCGHCMGYLLDYLVMQFLIHLVSRFFGNLIPALCYFCNCFLFFFVTLRVNFSIYYYSNGIGKVLLPGFVSTHNYVGYTFTVVRRALDSAQQCDWPVILDSNNHELQGAPCS